VSNVALLLELNTRPWLIPQAWAQSNAQLIASVLTGKSAFPFGNAKTESGFDTYAVKKVNNHVVVDKRDLYMWGKEIPENSIFELSIEGPIFRTAECAYGAMDYANWFNMAAANDNVIGATIKINSPGGSAYGTQLLVQAIHDFRSLGKPVVGYVNDGQAASAGYWIISACDEVYLSGNTDAVGSIGAYTTLYDFTGFLKKNGIALHEIYAPQSTEKNKDYHEALKGNYKPIQDQLAKLVDEFTTQVKSTRHTTLAADALKGAMYMGQDAIDAGLADGIQNYAHVLNRVKKLSGTTHNKTQNSSTMFGNKFKALNALAGNTEPTTEQIAAANAELVEAGITLASLITKSQADLAAGNVTKITTLEGDKTTLTTERDELKAERDTLKARNEELEAWATEAGADPAKITTNVPDKETKGADAPLVVTIIENDPVSQAILKNHA
jgi:protease-4